MAAVWVKMCFLFVEGPGSLDQVVRLGKSEAEGRDFSPGLSLTANILPEACLLKFTAHAEPQARHVENWPRVF